MKSKVKILTQLGAALGLFTMLSGSAQAVLINTYTAAADWTSAVGSYATEDFEDLTLQAPLQSFVSENGEISGGTFNDLLIPESSAAATIFTFNPGIYGIGADWDLGPLTVGTGLEVHTLNGTYDIGEVSVDPAGFWGFTIDESISFIVLTNGPNCCRENYTIDNMMMATSASTVPEPGILALMGIGLAGMGFSRRKRNTAI